MQYTLQEHLAKKLVSPDSITEQVYAVTNASKENVKILNEAAKGKNRKLIVTMEAIHVGRTRNHTFYTEEGLKAGLSSWTHPYNKPVLTHHNERNGEPIGRILKAEYSEKTLSGKPGLIFTCEITDPDAIEKVLDGRYQTVSIGASTDKVVCNICGTDRTQEWCEHFPGEKYEEQTCHFIIGTTYGREVSYVNTPSDENAGNRTVEIVTDDGSTKESAHMQVYQMAEGLYQSLEHPEINLYEQLDKEAKKLFDEVMSKAKGGENLMEQQGKIDESNETKTTVSQENNTIQEQQAEKGNTAETGETAPANNISEQKQDVHAEANTNESIDALKTKITEMQGVITNLVMEKTKLESRIAELENENQTLVSENTKLVSEMHRSLAEKVVDLKLSLRKADVVGVTREEAIEMHLTRTKESLADTYQDLLLEAKNARPEPGSVKNPIHEDEGVHMNESASSQGMTAKEAVETLKYMFSPKKRK
jgi:hypothetical protein